MSKKVLLVLALVAIVLPVLVAAQAPEELATPCAFLSWAGTAAGLVVILGLLQAWAVEYIPTWPNIPSKWKRPILFGMALGVSFLALVGKAQLCGAVISLQTLWEAGEAAALVFTVNQVWQGRKLEGTRNSRLLASRIV